MESRELRQLVADWYMGLGSDVGGSVLKTGLFTHDIAVDPMLRLLEGLNLRASGYQG